MLQTEPHEQVYSWVLSFQYNLLFQFSIHVWQSRKKLNITYFDRIAMFKVQNFC